MRIRRLVWGVQKVKEAARRIKKVRGAKIVGRAKVDRRVEGRGAKG